jgi:hypothetical protein
MRIFSKYHDYYDTALGYGIDPSIIYERKDEDITDLYSKQPFLYDKLSKIYSKVFDFNASRIDNEELQVLSKNLIIFCGKIYSCIEVVYKIKNTNKTIEKSIESTTEFVYTYEAFNKIITNYTKINLEKNLSDYFSYNMSNMSADKRFKLLFEKQGIESKDATDLHFKLDSPLIVMIRNTSSKNGKIFTIHKNSCLKNIEFYKIVSPFEAFQELSMFIGGIMGGKSPIMIEIADKDRIAKHGFDKFSFRKEKK